MADHENKLRQCVLQDVLSQMNGLELTQQAQENARETNISGLYK